MNLSERFQTYTKTVCDQIRWKKAHAMISKELYDHLEDQKEVYIANGDSETEAEEKAVLQMGDAVSVGMALDKTHKPAPQWGMMVLIFFLLCIGSFLQYRVYALVAQEHEFHLYLYQQRAFWFPLIGIALFLGFYFLDFSFFGKHPYLLPVLLLIGICFKNLFGVQVNGQYWLSFGSFSLSPTLYTLLFPLGYSGLLYQFRNQGIYGFCKAICLLLTVAMLLYVTSTAGCLFLFGCSVVILLFVANCRRWFGTKTTPVFCFFLLTGIAVTVLFLISSPYRLNRIVHTLHPETDPNGYGYLAYSIRTMLENAKLFGSGNAIVGTAESLSFPYNSLSPLPYNTIATDFFLAFLTYQYGWGLSIGLVLLLLCFLVWSFHKCWKQKSILGQMVSLSILSVFSVECFFYILSNLGLPFLASAALPFLSYGFGNTVVHMALAGVLLSVFRTGEAQQDTIQNDSKEHRFLQWNNGTLLVKFR